ncbi:MAG TPA: oxygenase MpaB family protein [Nocardioidaceae bacterium]|nr:oxygenase MpaB family protein [Nocardioidaceae bacterium]
MNALATLPPASLLQRYAGDWRSMLPGISAGILQLTHPAIGAGVHDHSRFAEENDARLIRSIPQIWGTVLGAPEGVPRRGRDIRDAHRAISGTDHTGVGYHALDPETFWWAHATFTWEIFRSIELFHPRRLSDIQVERLYQDTVDWYALYGLTPRPAPADYGAFLEKFDRVCTEVLVLTPTARALGVGRPVRPRSRGGLRRLARSESARVRGRLGVGCLPETVRQQLDLPWSPADQRWFDGFDCAVRQGFRLVPQGVNRASLTQTLRVVGARTRDERIRIVKGARDVRHAH